jgi:hypothetical protein
MTAQPGFASRAGTAAPASDRPVPWRWARAPWWILRVVSAQNVELVLIADAPAVVWTGAGGSVARMSFYLERTQALPTAGLGRQGGARPLVELDQ